MEKIDKFIKSLENIYGDSRNQVALINGDAVVIWCNTIPLNRFEELTPGMELSKVFTSVYWPESRVTMKRGKAVRMMTKVNGQNFHLYIEPFIKNEEFQYSLVHIAHERMLHDLSTAVTIHDIKNPVNMILSMVKNKNDEESELIRHYCETALATISDMSVFASDTEDITVAENMEITQFVGRIFDEAQKVLGKRFKIDVNKCSKTLCSRVIPKEIENAVMNLIVNAKNHCDSYIKLEIYEHDGFAVIAVENDGDTVDNSIKDRVYEPCVRANSTGSGLGLFSVKRVAEKHNGKIVLADAERARFELSIPLSTDAVVKNSGEQPDVNITYIKYVLERENG